jgi:uncharacterized membrane protein YtjA (UPF0391 family)
MRRSRLSINSVTFAVLLISGSLGWAGVTLTSAHAGAVVYCQCVGYPPVALPGPVWCSGRARSRAPW